MDNVFLVSKSVFIKINDIIDDYHAFIEKGGDFDYTSEDGVRKFINRLDEIQREEGRQYEPSIFSIDINANIRCLGRLVIPSEYIPEDYFILIADDYVRVRKSNIGDIQDQMRNEVINYIRSLSKN